MTIITTYNYLTLSGVEITLTIGGEVTPGEWDEGRGCQQPDYVNLDWVQQQGRYIPIGPFKPETKRKLEAALLEAALKQSNP